jgi:uncharacterized cupredoxin-like copper-binding protein
MRSRQAAFHGKRRAGRDDACGSTEKNMTLRNSHIAVCAGVVALGLVSGAAYAKETVKATLSNDTIKLDTDSVKAGTVTFEATNASDTKQIHELVVLKTDMSADKLPVKNGAVPEKQFRKMGEVEDMAPGKSKHLTLKLTPGNYVLICNQPGHYAMGMHVPFVVTP